MAVGIKMALCMMWVCIIGTNHGFACVNVRHVPRDMIKPSAKHDIFNISRVYELIKTIFDRYYCIDLTIFSPK